MGIRTNLEGLVGFSEREGGVLKWEIRSGIGKTKLF
jgi:hypothetical protein